MVGYLRFSSHLLSHKDNISKHVHVLLDVSVPVVAHSCRIFVDEVFVLTVTIPTGFS